MRLARTIDKLFTLFLALSVFTVLATVFTKQMDTVDSEPIAMSALSEARIEEIATVVAEMQAQRARQLTQSSNGK